MPAPFVTVTLVPDDEHACFGACLDPIPRVLHLTSDGTCDAVDFPDDTLTCTATPAWLTPYFATPNVWLGETPFTLATGFAATDYLYVMPDNGNGLWMVSESLPHAKFLGDPTPVDSCRPFLWTFICDDESFDVPVVFGGTIAE